MRSMITNQLKTGIDMMLTNLSSTLNMMSPLISSLGITLDDIAPVVESGRRYAFVRLLGNDKAPVAYEPALQTPATSFSSK